jgi:hypothetical protein
MLQSLKSLANTAIIALCTKAKQTLLQAAALYLLVSKWLLKAIAVLGPRRLNELGNTTLIKSHPRVAFYLPCILLCKD